MHPIERLRYVVRSSGAPQDLLVQETAASLATFRGDTNGLVTACRRVVARQLTSGPLWWLCSRVLTDPDPLAAARAAVEEMDTDPTAHELAHALPDSASVLVLGWPDLVARALPRRGDLEVLVVDTLDEGGRFVDLLDSRDVNSVHVPLAGLGAAAAESDLVVLEASAVGPEEFLAVAGSRAAAAVATLAGVPVWLVAGVGRLLPTRVWDSLIGRLDQADEPWDCDDDVVPLDLVDRVLGPGGLEEPTTALTRADCPVAPELFKDSV